MLSIQRWKPDTCDCVLYQVFDPDIPGDEPRHIDHAAAEAVIEARRLASPVTTSNEPLPPPVQCSAHVFLVNPHDEVLDENRRKNSAWADIETRFPTVVFEDFKWSFDATRTLVVDVPSLTPAQRGTLRAALVAKHGASKVRVI